MGSVPEGHRHETLSLAAALPAVLSPAAPQGDRICPFFRHPERKPPERRRSRGTCFCPMCQQVPPLPDRVSQCVECDSGLLSRPGPLQHRP